MVTVFYAFTGSGMQLQRQLTQIKTFSGRACTFEIHPTGQRDQRGTQPRSGGGGAEGTTGQPVSQRHHHSELALLWGHIVRLGQFGHASAAR
jgi:hypothetical protein